ncbi:MAG: PAS domain-containing protein [Hyphomonas sp.]|nr:PAS domain-containing protein [Hyphomonas sp.]
MLRLPDFGGVLLAGPDIMDAVLTSLLDNSRDCIKLLDPQGRVLYINRTGLAVRQIAGMDDVLGRFWWELWPTEAEAAVREATSNAASGKMWDFRGFCPTSRGVPKWWDVRTSPVSDASGDIARILVVSKDVTDAVTNRKMYETVALEMRHRLKNAFAVSSAITKMSARSAPEHTSFAEGLVSRFSALAVAQGKLVDSAKDFPLRELVSDIVNAAGVGEEVFDVSGLPDCRVGESGMRVIAVVIGELTTNSLKYGALRSGSSVRCEGTIDDCWLQMSWLESLEGIDLDTEMSSSTNTGLDVMKRIVVSAGGNIDRDFDGARLLVKFSLPFRSVEDTGGT